MIDFKFVGAFLLILIGQGMMAQVTLYNIDFKASYAVYEGKGILGTVPDSKWNGLKTTNVANVPLVDSRGAAENATVSTSGFGGSFGLRFSFAWGDFADYWYLSSSNSPVISFKNLAPGQPYDLILYCYTGDKEVTQASVNGGASKATSGIRSVIQWAESPDPNGNYLRFKGQVPTNGSININLSATSTGANIQGLQLQIGTITIPQGARKYKLIPDLAAGYNLKVMSIGTSLTDMPFGISWPSELYSALFPKYQGYEILSNRAISGSDSKSGVANIEDWLALDNPDVVFIEYAINDAVANSNISVAQMKSNLDFICAKILANNPKAQIILQTMNNPIGSTLTDRPNIELYYQGYRDYAKEKGYLLVDNYPLWKSLYDTNPTLWKTYVPDNIHPTEEGRRAIMLPNLIKTLEGELNPDKTAPSVPTDITASSITSVSVVLDWNASTDNVGVTGYDVYQGNTLIGSPTSNTFKVTSLTAGTAYTFTVKAKDLANNISAASSPFTVNTKGPDLIAPSKPNGLTAKSVTGRTVQLNWTISTDNEEVVGYEVYKDDILIGSPASNEFLVTGLTPNTNFNFTIKAKDAAGNASIESDVLKVVTIGVDEVTSRGDNKPGEGLDKLTDGDLNSKWLDFSATSWVQFSNASGQIWNTYEITSGDDAPERDPKSWTILGSNDGVTWTTLDNRVEQTWATRKLTRTFSFTNSTAYNFYKWDITAVGGASIIQASEFRFNGIITRDQGPTSQNITVYPNPVSDVLMLAVGIYTISEISIYDLQGIKVLSKKDISSGIEYVDVKNLYKGIYHLKITVEDKIINTKFAKH